MKSTEVMYTLVHNVCSINIDCKNFITTITISNIRLDWKREIVSILIIADLKGFMA
jgi:hypothetical protein